MGTLPQDTIANSILYKSMQHVISFSYLVFLVQLFFFYFEYVFEVPQKTYIKSTFFIIIF